VSIDLLVVFTPTHRGLHMLIVCQGVTLPEDEAGREAKHAYNKRLQAQRQRRRDSSAVWMMVRACEEDTPSELESPCEDDEE
jgi:hypothetical protein